MSDDTKETRNRGRSLLIVEGNHEKHELFWLIFRCFPEININMDYIWIYGTNIYMLYHDIEKEYGMEWTEDDIDLPFVISRKKKLDPLCYKEDFINIVLVFDYERHDTNFSETKILKMQNYFSDATDVGKLYINYPMIESYQDVWAWPDQNFISRKVSVSLQPGKKYKELVRERTVIADIVNFPHKIENLLQEHFEVKDRQACQKCCEAILAVSEKDKIEKSVEMILQKVMEGKNGGTAKYHFADLISKAGYAHNGKTYWEFMRNILQKIVKYNIEKAYRIQKNQTEIDSGSYKDHYKELDLAKILEEQNKASRDRQNGFIWVLNTCVFFVAEYNLSLVGIKDRLN